VRTRARLTRGEITPARRLKRWIVAGATLFAQAVVRAFPLHSDPALARTLRFWVVMLWPALRRRLRDHLRLVYGATTTAGWREDLASRVMSCTARGAIEFIRLSQTTPKQLQQRIRVNGQGHLRQALAGGRGVIMLTGHYGNFEMMAALCAAYDLDVTVIARASDEDLVEQYVGAIRAQHKVRVVHKQAWREAFRTLENGGIVGILADQAAARGGIMADFLGHPAPTALGPFMLAQRTGAPVLPCFIQRDPNGFMTVDMHRPLQFVESGDEDTDALAFTQRMNDAIGAQIRMRPEEWHWVHRRWKTPVAVRRAARKSDSPVDL